MDANHLAVMEMYRRAGFSVKDVSRLEKFVDLVVGAYGYNHLVEVKDGSKRPSAQKLTADEQEFHDGWRGTITVVRTESDVIGHIRDIRLSAAGK